MTTQKMSNPNASSHANSVSDKASLIATMQPKANTLNKIMNIF